MTSSLIAAAPPATGGARRHGIVRDRAPLAAASIGAVVVVAVALVAVASRLEAARNKIAQTALDVTTALDLRLENIVVAGRGFTKPRDIVDVLDVAPGDSLLSLDPRKARQRLENLPWVKQAVVERLFPHDVRINLVERAPIALWQTRGGEFHLVDADGVVIDDAIAPFQSLPVVTGAGSPQATSDLLAMLDAYPELAPRLAAAVRFGRRRWDLWFDGYGVQTPDDAPAHNDAAAGSAALARSPPGVQVRLPEQGAERALARLTRLERAYGILRRGLAMIDLRQPDRLIIRRTFATETPARPEPPPARPWPGPSLGGSMQDA